jgi:hypothetical protein
LLPQRDRTKYCDFSYWQIGFERRDSVFCVICTEGGSMMGTQAVPERLFYDFCLEDHVPDDHLLRRIDRFLDLSDVGQKLKSFYCTIGRPSIDPELMIRMLIVGYCFAIRSERRLCEEVPSISPIGGFVA